jgi:hypothetical protein
MVKMSLHEKGLQLINADLFCLKMMLLSKLDFSNEDTASKATIYHSAMCEFEQR